MTVPIRTSPCACGADGVERRLYQCPKCDESWTDHEQGTAWERDRDRSSEAERPIEAELFYACLNSACDARVASHSILCDRCKQAWEMGREYATRGS